MVFFNIETKKRKFVLFSNRTDAQSNGLEQTVLYFSCFLLNCVRLALEFRKVLGKVFNETNVESLKVRENFKRHDGI